MFVMLICCGAVSLLLLYLFEKAKPSVWNLLDAMQNMTGVEWQQFFSSTGVLMFAFVAFTGAMLWCGWLLSIWVLDLIKREMLGENL
ncbi:hypothetical protein [Vogesella indigofera]|uniref:hypothetical protein n=1 Tax=Vogesella indigofera TaxID=45465 RepID=UPI0035AD87CE